MTKAEARLEALKLAVRPGVELSSILEVAEQYAAFIMRGQEGDSETPRQRDDKAGIGRKRP